MSGLETLTSSPVLLVKSVGCLGRPCSSTGSATGDEFEVLTMLIEAYEQKHYPIAPPHPIEAIKFRLDQLGMSETELNVLLGSRSRKSEILSGKRKLNLSMIRVLDEKLQIPAESLLLVY